MSDTILVHFDSGDDFERCLDEADAATCGRAEMKFVDELREKWEEFGTRTFLSEKQAEWLKRIAGWED